MFAKMFARMSTGAKSAPKSLPRKIFTRISTGAKSAPKCLLERFLLGYLLVQGLPLLWLRF